MEDIPQKSTHETSELYDELWSEALSKGLQIRMRIASASMEPTLVPGDYVVVAPYAPGRNPRRGDLVLFRILDQWIIHRIVGELQRSGRVFFRQKGDADFYSATTSAEDVAGKVIAFERNGCLKRLDAGGQIIIQRMTGCGLAAVDWINRKGGAARPPGTGSDEAMHAWRILGLRMIRRTGMITARGSAWLSGRCK